ncbi:MAG TPA: response regulator [Chryseosolibacter sp.]|nr:response regulator [Chryseosolibacter sp.]
MEKVKSGPSSLNSAKNEGIEIKLWEIYLLRNRTGLYVTLSRYALDNGPVEKTLTDRDMVTFRFTIFDWERNVEQLFADHKIPFWVHHRFKLDAMSAPKKRVLIAEDDPDILSRMNVMLRQQGFDVSITMRGKTVFEESNESADVIILDKRLPDADVFGVCRQLRAQAETRETPVIVISSSRNIGEQAKSAGVTDFLVKPFQMEDLLRMVNRYTKSETRLVADLH